MAKFSSLSQELICLILDCLAQPSSPPTCTCCGQTSFELTLLSTALTSKSMLYHSRKLAFASVRINPGPESPLDTTRALAEILETPGNTIAVHIKDFCVFYLHHGLRVSQDEIDAYEMRVRLAGGNGGRTINGRATQLTERLDEDGLDLATPSEVFPNDEPGSASLDLHTDQEDSDSDTYESDDDDDESQASYDPRADAIKHIQNEIIYTCMTTFLPRVLFCLSRLQMFKLQIETPGPDSDNDNDGEGEGGSWADLWDVPEFRTSFETIIRQPSFTGLWVLGLPLYMSILEKNAGPKFRNLHLHYINFLDEPSRGGDGDHVGKTNEAKDGEAGSMSLSRLHLNDWSTMGVVPWEQAPCPSLSTVSEAIISVGQNIIKRNILTCLLNKCLSNSLTHLVLGLNSEAFLTLAMDSGVLEGAHDPRPTTISQAFTHLPVLKSFKLTYAEDTAIPEVGVRFLYGILTDVIRTLLSPSTAIAPSPLEELKIALTVPPISHHLTAAEIDFLNADAEADLTGQTMPLHAMANIVPWVELDGAAIVVELESLHQEPRIGAVNYFKEALKGMLTMIFDTCTARPVPFLRTIKVDITFPVPPLDNPTVMETEEERRHVSRKLRDQFDMIFVGSMAGLMLLLEEKQFDKSVMRDRRMEIRLKMHSVPEAGGKPFRDQTLIVGP